MLRNLDNYFTAGVTNLRETESYFMGID